DDDNDNLVTYKFDPAGNLKSQDGDDTLTLRCTATDASGNTAVAETTATASGDDDDDDGADKRTLDETTVESSIPEGYALFQNHPNPFNPNTTITFAVPEAGEVTLAIYNLMGQLIRTLHSGPIAAGLHSVVWNSTDFRGAKVASGIYVYKLRAGDFSEVKKMSLLR
ncbi:T9SS type A sorting domain-containing protein, partial [bacterium]|nr:T9SS type A sorting domain-containing protein [bacterium]